MDPPLIPLGVGPSHSGLAVEVEPGVLREGLDEGYKVVYAAGIREAVVQHREAEIAYPAAGAEFFLRHCSIHRHLAGAAVAAGTASFNLLAHKAVDDLLLILDDLLVGQAPVVPVLLTV